jgi:hypothetical protein
VTDDLAVLVIHLERYADMRAPLASRRQYGHMGATLCDAILQAGLNYRFVVAPRITRLLALWPSATTTSRFLIKARRYGLNDVLAWRDPVKLQRIDQLSDFMQTSGVETESCLRSFLGDDNESESLMSLSGVGPKTVDYLKILAGMSTLAVDRHVRAVLAQAGVAYTGYADARNLMIAAAERLQIDPAVLDGRIWAAASGSQVAASV